METILTLHEVADRLRCSPKHVRELVNDGNLKCIDIGRGGKRRMLRFLEEAVRDFINKGKHDKCQSIADQASRTSPTTSGYAVIDFRALQKLPREERLKRLSAPAKSKQKPT